LRGRVFCQTCQRSTTHPALGTGLVLDSKHAWTFSQGWIVLALALYVASFLIGAAFQSLLLVLLVIITWDALTYALIAAAILLLVVALMRARGLQPELPSPKPFPFGFGTHAI
jgi:hypothetical protein